MLSIIFLSIILQDFHAEKLNATANWIAEIRYERNKSVVQKTNKQTNKQTQNKQRYKKQPFNIKA